MKKVAGEKIVEDSAKRRMKVKGRMKVAAQLLQDSGRHDGVGPGVACEQILTRIYSSEPEDFSIDEGRQHFKLDLAVPHSQGRVQEIRQVPNKAEERKQAGPLVSSQLELWKDGKSKAHDITAGKILKPIGADVQHPNPGSFKDLANIQKLDPRFGLPSEEKRWKEATKDLKVLMPVSVNPMMPKMSQHSTKEEGIRDIEGAAGRSSGSGVSSCFGFASNLVPSSV